MQVCMNQLIKATKMCENDRFAILHILYYMLSYRMDDYNMITDYFTTISEKERKMSKLYFDVSHMLLKLLLVCLRCCCRCATFDKSCVFKRFLIRSLYQTFFLWLRINRSSSLSAVFYRK